MRAVFAIVFCALLALASAASVELTAPATYTAEDPAAFVVTFDVGAKASIAVAEYMVMVDDESVTIKRDGEVVSDGDLAGKGRSIWVTSADGELSVGQGTVGTHVKAVAMLKNRLVNGVTFAAGSVVSNVQMIDADYNVNEFTAPEFDAKDGYVQFNQPNYLPTVSTSGFEVKFEVMAAKTASIALLPKRTGKSDEAYEVVLGASAEIRHGTQGRKLIGSKTAVALKADSFRAFWMRMSEGVLSVGRGKTVGERVLMRANVPAVSSKTLTMGFSGSRQAPATFRINSQRNVKLSNKKLSPKDPKCVALRGRIAQAKKASKKLANKANRAKNFVDRSKKALKKAKKSVEIAQRKRTSPVFQRNQRVAKGKLVAKKAALKRANAKVGGAFRVLTNGMPHKQVQLEKKAFQAWTNVQKTRSKLNQVKAGFRLIVKHIPNKPVKRVAPVAVRTAAVKSAQTVVVKATARVQKAQQAHQKAKTATQAAKRNVVVAKKDLNTAKKAHETAKTRVAQTAQALPKQTAPKKTATVVVAHQKAKTAVIKTKAAVSKAKTALKHATVAVVKAKATEKKAARVVQVAKQAVKTATAKLAVTKTALLQKAQPVKKAPTKSAQAPAKVAVKVTKAPANVAVKIAKPPAKVAAKAPARAVASKVVKAQQAVKKAVANHQKAKVVAQIAVKQVKAAVVAKAPKAAVQKAVANQVQAAARVQQAAKVVTQTQVAAKKVTNKLVAAAANIVKPAVQRAVQKVVVAQQVQVKAVVANKQAVKAVNVAKQNHGIQVNMAAKAKQPAIKQAGQVAVARAVVAVKAAQVQAKQTGAVAQKAAVAVRVATQQLVAQVKVAAPAPKAPAAGVVNRGAVVKAPAAAKAPAACPVAGPWGAWSACSKTCGGGVQTRQQMVIPVQKPAAQIAQLQRVVVVPGLGTVNQAQKALAAAAAKAAAAAAAAAAQRNAAQQRAAALLKAAQVAAEAKARAVVAAAKKVAPPVAAVKAAVKAVVKVAVQAKAAAVVAVAKAAVAAKVVAAMKPAAAARPYFPPFQFAASSASDDPHFSMWDGKVHDAMVHGWFTYVQSPILTVQAYSSYCGGADTAQAPTCIKKGVIEVRVPGTAARLVVTSTGHIKEFGGLPKVGSLFLGGRYSASTGSVSSTGVCHTNPDCALSARVSSGSMSFSLPRGGSGYGKTNGLVGFFSGDKSLEGNFRNRDGSPSELRSNQGDNALYCGWGGCSVNGLGAGRINGPRVLRWSMQFAVGKNGNTPIDLGMPTAQMQQFWNSGTAKINLMEVATSTDSQASVSWTFPVAKALKAKPVVVTPKKQAFCDNLLKGVKKNRKQHMKSCIMDSDFPDMAKAIVKTIKTVAKQTRAVKVELKRAVRGQQRLAVRCGIKSVSSFKKNPKAILLETEAQVGACPATTQTQTCNTHACPVQKVGQAVNAAVAKAAAVQAKPNPVAAALAAMRAGPAGLKAAVAAQKAGPIVKQAAPVLIKKAAPVVKQAAPVMVKKAAPAPVRHVPTKREIIVRAAAPMVAAARARIVAQPMRIVAAAPAARR